MKAISLWQPWATALFLTVEGYAGPGAGPSLMRLKPDETRRWPTAYRGRLAIHAAKFNSRPDIDFDPELDRILLALLGRRCADLPHGALLGTVEIVNCKRTTQITRHPAQLKWGDYRERGDDGKLRFAWVTADPEPLRAPIPWKGAQGSFDVPSMLFPAPQPTEFELKP